MSALRQLKFDCKSYVSSRPHTDIQVSEAEFTIRREIGANGRTRAFIEDQSVNIKFLREIAPFIVELHMQGEQQSLSNTRTQLHFLDEYAGCTPLRREVEILHAESYRVADELAKLENHLSENERARDYLNYQLAEIDSTNPVVGEDEELENERTLLLNAEKVSQLKNSIHEILYSDDESILSRLKNVRKYLQELSSLDHRLGVCLDSLDNANMMLTDIAETIRDDTNDFDSTVNKLNRVEERLSNLEKLKRRYGQSLSEVLASKSSIQNKILEIDTGEEKRSLLASALHQVNRKYINSAAKLSVVRRSASEKFSADVAGRLPDVALSHANFKIDVVSADFDKAVLDASLRVTIDGLTLGNQGGDSIEFLFTANPGEELRSLAQIASGGELSRLMLIIKETARFGMSRETFGQVPLIFDEIDAGISGSVAETVGRKLALLAQNQQVLCVTHQAQIARFADSHFKVEKNVEAGRTKSSIRKLDSAGRVKEIANLITANESEPSVQKTAKWLVDSARAENRALAEKNLKIKLRSPKTA